MKEDIANISDKKRNAADLNRIRDAIANRMKQDDFEALCLQVLKYTTNAWEIESVRNSKQAVSEPWVRKVQQKKNVINERYDFF